MERWRTRRADRALRFSGLVLLAVAGAALRWLYALHVPPQSAGLLAYGLGAVGYMAASSGTALVMLGRHLFDEVAVSPRWGRHRGGGVGGSRRMLLDRLEAARTGRGASPPSSPRRRLGFPCGTRAVFQWGRSQPALG